MLTVDEFTEHTCSGPKKRLPCAQCRRETRLRRIWEAYVECGDLLVLVGGALEWDEPSIVNAVPSLKVAGQAMDRFDESGVYWGCGVHRRLGVLLRRSPELR